MIATNLDVTSYFTADAACKPTNAPPALIQVSKAATDCVSGSPRGVPHEPIMTTRLKSASPAVENFVWSALITTVKPRFIRAFASVLAAGSIDGCRKYRLLKL